MLASPSPRIAVVADHDPTAPSHLATDAALRIARDTRFPSLEYEWVPTDGVSIAALERFNGIWAGPRSPYADPEGMYAAIRYARESGKPFVAT